MIRFRLKFISRDKLRERIRNPDTDKIHEFFDPGRPHGLKEHIIIEGKTTEIHFYPSSRSDGLVKRVEMPNKVRHLKNQPKWSRSNEF